MITAFSFARHFLPLIGTAALACSAPVMSSQPQPTTVSASAIVAASSDPALWVVSDEDTTIYLFGTVHMMRPGVVWFDDEVKAAFDRSQELVLEVTEDKPSEMAITIALMGLNEEGPTRDMVKPELRQAYLDALAEYKIPADAMDRFEPWLVAINLSIAPLAKLGYRQELGAERILATSAKETDKKISGLETTEEQLGFFDALPREAQIAYLNATVEQLPDVEKQFDMLMTNWKTGDSMALATLMNESIADTPELAQALLYDRNARWSEWISKRMGQPGAVFMAVGAGHLAGEKSVIDLLKGRKMKVQRLSKKDFGLE